MKATKTLFRCEMHIFASVFLFALNPVFAELNMPQEGSEQIIANQEIVIEPKKNYILMDELDELDNLPVDIEDPIAESEINPDLTAADKTNISPTNNSTDVSAIEQPKNDVLVGESDKIASSPEIPAEQPELTTDLSAANGDAISSTDLPVDVAAAEQPKNYILMDELDELTADPKAQIEELETNSDLAATGGTSVLPADIELSSQPKDNIVVGESNENPTEEFKLESNSITADDTAILPADPSANAVMAEQPKNYILMDELDELDKLDELAENLETTLEELNAEPELTVANESETIPVDVEQPTNYVLLDELNEITSDLEIPAKTAVPSAEELAKAAEAKANFEISLSSELMYGPTLKTENPIEEHGDQRPLYLENGEPSSFETENILFEHKKPGMFNQSHWSMLPIFGDQSAAKGYEIEPPFVIDAIWMKQEQYINPVDGSTKYFNLKTKDVMEVQLQREDLAMAMHGAGKMDNPSMEKFDVTPPKVPVCLVWKPECQAAHKKYQEDLKKHFETLPEKTAHNAAVDLVNTVYNGMDTFNATVFSGGIMLKEDGTPDIEVKMGKTMQSSTTKGLRAGFWLFPFMQIYGTYQKMTGQSIAEETSRVRIDANDKNINDMLAGKPVDSSALQGFLDMLGEDIYMGAIEGAIENAVNNIVGPGSYKGGGIIEVADTVVMDLDADIFGAGVTIAGGYKKLFMMIDMNYTYSKFDFSDDYAKTFVISPRIGYNGRLFGKPFRWWVGAMGQYVSQKMTGRISAMKFTGNTNNLMANAILPNSEFEVKQKLAAPINYLVGARYTFTPYTALLVEYGYGGSGGREQLMFNFEFLF